MEIWVSQDRCTLVHRHVEGEVVVMTVATRPDSDAVWGPPVKLEQEQ
jgi:hypothetical protein